MTQSSQSDLKPILREPYKAEELEAFQQLRLEHLPRHVAVIMDGNGRWAKGKGLAARIFGHRAGIDSVRNITRTAAALRLHGLTLYAFSKENWSRPAKEINGLMDLLDQFLKDEVPELMENNVRLVASGDLDDLRDKTRKNLNKTIETTSGNTGLTLNLALSYSGRAELIRAVGQAMKLSAEGKMSPEDLNADSFSQLLDHPELGDPDLLIRTSGEMRVSNFLLWQIAYTEFVITDTLWPDFRRIHFFKAIAEYQQRDRRFGGVS